MRNKLSKIKDDEYSKSKNLFKKKLQKNNKTGYTGVIKRKGYNKFRAIIKYLKKQIFIGYFDTAKDAMIARNKYIIDNSLPIKTDE